MLEIICVPNHQNDVSSVGVADVCITSVWSLDVCDASVMGFSIGFLASNAPYDRISPFIKLFSSS